MSSLTSSSVFRTRQRQQLIRDCYEHNKDRIIKRNNNQPTFVFDHLIQQFIDTFFLNNNKNESSAIPTRSIIGQINETFYHSVNTNNNGNAYVPRRRRRYNLFVENTSNISITNQQRMNCFSTNYNTTFQRVASTSSRSGISFSEQTSSAADVAQSTTTSSSSASFSAIHGNNDTSNNVNSVTYANISKIKNSINPLFSRNGTKITVIKSTHSSQAIGNHYNSSSDSDNKNNSSTSSNKNLLDHWKEQIVSIPNMITITRLMASPMLAYWVVTNQTEKALIGCCIAGVSDIVDGYVARNYNMSTTLGTYLDPLADKVLINVLSVALCMNGTLPGELVLLWISRDIGLMTGTYFVVKRQTAAGVIVMDPVTTPLKVNPTVISKVNTGLQFLTLSIGIGIIPIATYIYPNIDQVLLGLCYLTGTTTIVSGLSYIGHSAFSDSGNIVLVSSRKRRKEKPKNGDEIP